MLTLYDNAFSPFARKVRMVLRFKGLQYRSVDALALDARDHLVSVNPRAEVPVLVDGDVTVLLRICSAKRRKALILSIINEGYLLRHLPNADMLCFDPVVPGFGHAE